MTRKSRVRAETNFANSYNPIAPVQSSHRKYSALCSPQISRILSRIPPHEEGRIAIVTNVEAGSGGRETSQRIFRADERGLADGQAVWSWHPDAGVKLAMMLTHHAGDGGKKARFTEESAE